MKRTDLEKSQAESAPDARAGTGMRSDAPPRRGGLGRGVWLRRLAACALLAGLWQPCGRTGAAAPPQARPAPPAAALSKADSFQLQGAIKKEDGQIVIQARFLPWSEKERTALWAARIEHKMTVEPDRIRHRAVVRIETLEGVLRRVRFALEGDGEVTGVAGPQVGAWSVERLPDGKRFLTVTPAAEEGLKGEFAFTATAETKLPDMTASARPLCFIAEKPALAGGFLRIDAAPEMAARVAASSGLTPAGLEFAPEGLAGKAAEGAQEPLLLRFAGAPYSLRLDVQPADPEARQISLSGFSLEGEISEGRASFALVATAKTRSPKGGALRLLAGRCALKEVHVDGDGRPELRDGALWLRFDKPGEYPLRLRFDAAVEEKDGWKSVEFHVAPGPLQPIAVAGLPADTQLRTGLSRRPERAGGLFRDYVPADGRVFLAWKGARKEAAARLFYGVDAFRQIVVRPGLLEQSFLFEYKVMQGKLDRLDLELIGEGEVTKVAGKGVLAWSVEPAPKEENGKKRLLVVRLNRAQTGSFSIQVQTRQPLGAFPVEVAPLRVEPAGATRFGGYVRIVNRGAVRLEVAESSGLSQISPERLPSSDAIKRVLAPGGGQTFAFRFSGLGARLLIQADNILPEVSVSEALAYRLSETETSVAAELELDIREAPVRELRLRVPAGYALAKVEAQDVADYFLSGATNGLAELRILFEKPVQGRRLLQLVLERNQPFQGATWALPRIEVLQAKAVRGYVGAAAAAGYLLTPGKTQGLTEMATAFFPKPLENIQAAYRINDPAWELTLQVQRLPQTIQADVFHLFSVGEGAAYGSTVIQYVVSGAPISRLHVDLSPEYSNVEFTGKDIRNWQKSDQGYDIFLHTPVTGDYTLLATYERPFNPQGETIAFSGARPADAASEHGYTIVISAFQFQVEPVKVSPGLTRLEPGEVPETYRLFFDAPILAAYRYTARPYELRLALKPLAQVETAALAVDRAVLETAVSKEGQVLTSARYFVKNRGRPHLGLAVPDSVRLWSVTVNGRSVVPIRSGSTNLIPIQAAGSDALTEVAVKLASKAPRPRRVSLVAPAVDAPVLWTQWKIEPDQGRRLVWAGGDLRPAKLAGYSSGSARLGVWAGAAFALLCFIATGWGLRRLVPSDGSPSRTRLWIGGGFCLLLAGAGAAALLAAALSLAANTPPVSLALSAPVREAGSLLRVEVRNEPLHPSTWSQLLRLWPALFALAALAWGRLGKSALRRTLGSAAAWTLAAWAVLRLPHPALPFGLLLLAIAIWEAVIPGLQRARKAGRAGRAAAVGLAALLSLAGRDAAAAQQVVQAAQAQTSAPSRPSPAFADSVVQRLTVADGVVSGRLLIEWTARRAGETLEVLYPPAVATAIDAGQGGGTRAVRASAAPDAPLLLVADAPGRRRVQIDCRLPVGRRGDNEGFLLPAGPALIHRVELMLEDMDVEVVAPEAVSLEQTTGVKEGKPWTKAVALLPPAGRVWIGWKPRSRDIRKEALVFYADSQQLWVPTAGILEGVHLFDIRPAQGQIQTLLFRAPEGATVTDASCPGLSFWRFDPDTRLLRLSFSSAQTGPFRVTIRSQIATRPLPYAAAAGLAAVEGAAGQVGVVGAATGNDVQLDRVDAKGLTPINLEDFPADSLAVLKDRIGGLTLRRAFRFSKPSGSLAISASAVEPDVQVVSRQTLSLGEDRTLLAAHLNVTVARAGIFKLSFILPEGMDVETLSGPAMTHWTERKEPEGRVVTLHLRTRTLGATSFDATLAGPGLKPRKGWPAPRLAIREARKQRGSLVIIPEQGMRLQPARREGVSQLDPAAQGVRAKGAFAFRLLQRDWRLEFDVEQVAPWIQAATLQQASVQEGRAQISLRIECQIENAGVRVLRVRLPAEAQSVRFLGRDLTDVRPLAEAESDPYRTWELKLARRVLGKVLLTGGYNIPLQEGTEELALRGPVVEGANLQRGWVAVRSGGRVTLQIAELPDALRPTEWEAVPDALRGGSAAPAAEYVFRLVRSDFALPLKVISHKAAPVLPARVEKFELTSIVSDDALMLTRGRLELWPGSKRLLKMRLPKGAQLWFALVNQSGVWVWREKEETLIPLDQAGGGTNAVVEFVYAARAGEGRGRRLRLRLEGPQFDLPLQDVSWTLCLDPKWRVEEWEGNMELVERRGARGFFEDLQSYLESERFRRKKQAEEAQRLLSFGNTLLQKGQTQQAAQAFKGAYALSQHDMAFNEDARVQLRNLKTQQAIAGLQLQRGYAQPVQAGQAAAPAPPQQRVQAPAQEDAALARLAERIVEQQESAMAQPSVLRVNFPEEGRRLRFARSLLVDRWAALRVEIEAFQPAGFGGGLLLLLTFIFAALLRLAGKGSKA